MVLSSLIKVAFDHCHGLGRMFGEGLGREARKVCEIAASQRVFECGEGRREQGGVRKRNEFGGSSGLHGGVALMEESRGDGRRWRGNETQMPKSGRGRSVSGEEQLQVAMDLNGGGVKCDDAPGVTELAHGEE